MGLTDGPYQGYYRAGGGVGVCHPPRPAWRCPKSTHAWPRGSNKKILLCCGTLKSRLPMRSHHCITPCMATPPTREVGEGRGIYSAAFWKLWSPTPFSAGFIVQHLSTRPLAAGRPRRSSHTSGFLGAKVSVRSVRSIRMPGCTSDQTDAHTEASAAIPIE